MFHEKVQVIRGSKGGKNPGLVLGYHRHDSAVFSNFYIFCSYLVSVTRDAGGTSVLK